MENEKERKIQVPPELYAPYGKPQKDTSLRDWGGFLFVALILSAMIIWGESEKAGSFVQKTLEEVGKQQMKGHGGTFP